MPSLLIVSLKRMSALLRALHCAAGVGSHELAVVYVLDDLDLRHVCDLEGPDLDDDGMDPDLHKVAALLMRAALNGGLAVVVLRTPLATGKTAVRTWRVHDLTAQPSTAAESFSAYCNGPNGVLTGPEPGVEYHDAPALTVSK
ncbi:hypothetical protein AB0C90_40220 [Streptomyces sp. NPDC048550]|uniref:hypothetical protein n=1 Tax=Streptomyces sp. NPDC048550 TaxID=3155739 RepID=UPI0034258B8D